jgi:hypothetical protein
LIFKTKIKQIEFEKKKRVAVDWEGRSEIDFQTHFYLRSSRKKDGK